MLSKSGHVNSTLWLLSDRFFRLILSFTVNIWVIRYLGPTNLGILSYAQSLVALFVGFSTIGIEDLVIKHLVSKNYPSEKIMGTTFILRLVGMSLSVLCLLVTMFFSVENSFTSLLVTIILIGSLTQVFNVFEWRFRADLKSKFVAYGNSITLILSATIKIYFILTGKSVTYFAFASIIEGFTYVLIFFYYFKRNYTEKIIDWKFDRGLMMELVKSGWPIGLSIIFGSIYARIDKVLMMEMLGPALVGQFFAATRLTETWFFVPMTVGASLFPAVIEGKVSDKHTYERRLLKIYGVIIWLCIGMGLFLTLTSKIITNTLFGHEYQQSADVLIISGWTVIFSSFGFARTRWLILENLQHLDLIFGFLGALTSILLNLYLIPRMGIEGAAWAALVSQVSTSIVFPFLIKGSRPSVKMFFESILIKHWLKR